LQFGRERTGWEESSEVLRKPYCEMGTFVSSGPDAKYDRLLIDFK